MGTPVNPENVLPPSQDLPAEPSTSSDPIPLKAVIGITIGSAVGLVLLIVSLFCLLRIYLRRRYRNQEGPRFDLEQPHSHVSSAVLAKQLSRYSAKGIELAPSKNVVVNLDEVDGGNVADLKNKPSTKEATPNNKFASILRWMEGAELPTPSTPPTVNSMPARIGSGSTSVGMGCLPMSPSTGATFSHISRGLSNFSMRVMATRFGDSDIKRKLLSGGYLENSASAPVDVQGVVFSRLPPSRRASPAPSMIEGSVASKARMKRPEAFEGHTLDASIPENIMVGRTSTGRPLKKEPSLARNSNRAGNPAVPLGSHAGMAFATIGSLADSIKHVDSEGVASADTNVLNVTARSGSMTKLPSVRSGRVDSLPPRPGKGRGPGSVASITPSVAITSPAGMQASPFSVGTVTPSTINPAVSSIQDVGSPRRRTPLGPGGRSTGGGSGGHGSMARDYEAAMGVLESAAGMPGSAAEHTITQITTTSISTSAAGAPPELHSLPVSSNPFQQQDQGLQPPLPVSANPFSASTTSYGSGAGGSRT